ncbi:MAG: hypothetical protein QXM53_00905 [Thermofilaceae archaeon]
MSWVRVPKAGGRKSRLPNCCVSIRGNRIYIPLATMLEFKLQQFKTWTLYINEEKTSIGLQFWKDGSGDRIVSLRPTKVNGKFTSGMTLWIKDISKRLKLPTGLFRLSQLNENFYAIDLRFPIKRG